MAITRVNHGTVATGTNPVPGEPAGIQPGDVLYCLCKTFGVAGHPAPTMAGEWTQQLSGVGTGALGSVLTARVFSFDYGGTAPADSTVTGSNAWAVVVAYRPSTGRYLTLEKATSHGTAGATSATVDYDSLTPIKADEMRIWAWLTSGVDTNGAISGTNPTPTEQLDSNGGYADGSLTASTPTGARTSTLSVAAINVGITLLLKEQSAPEALRARVGPDIFMNF